MDAIDLFIARTKADIRLGGEGAFYDHKLDIIEMPFPDFFDSKAEFYTVVFHELMHWTSHPRRLDWSFTQHIKDNPVIFSFYRAYQEVIADIGAGLMCIRFGLNPDSSPLRANHLAENLKQAGETPVIIAAALKRAKRAVRYLSNHYIAK